MKRFWSKVDIKSENECWNWKAAIASGYGHFFYNKRHWNAHRAIWVIINGDIPAGMLVMHSCDNKLCVNPKHLFLGTPRDNMQDMISKGRQSTGEKHGINNRGEKHSNSKLTENQIKEIRAIYGKGMGCYILAKKYNTRPQTIHAIITKKTWKHI